MFKDNQIIITSKVNKTNFLKQHNKELLNIKIYSLDEFNHLYFFNYNEETIYYIMTKYNTIYEIAKIYLENMYYLEDKKYQSNKLNFLVSLKKELIDHKLLKFSKLFLNYLNNKEIIFYNIPLSKEIIYLKNKLSLNNQVTVTTESKIQYNHHIYKFSTLEDEVVYIANSICNLIKKGINISNIYLTNLDDEYRKEIHRIFPMFNIPLTLNDNETIYSSFIATKFFELYSSDLNETLTNLSSYIDSEKSEDIYNKIVSLVNKYIFISDEKKVKEMLKYDFKNTQIAKVDISSSVHEVSLKDTIFTSNDYVFLSSFNQGVIPTLFKDEEYLNDKERQELSISLTVDKNNLERETIITKINSIENLIITYKEHFNNEEYQISSINDILNYEIIEDNSYDFSNSNIYNKIKLASLLDEYYKYGTKSSLLFTLNNHYQELPYKKYNHTFTGISKEDLQEYLNNQITLSYSTLDTYYRCPFSYYIANILKLNIYEDTFYQTIGTLFHSILEKINKTKLSYDELWNEELTKLNKEFTAKEKFFLTILKKELSFVIDVLKEQETFTNLHNELHEEKVYVSLSGDMKITFKGIIDKIKYKEENDETIIAIIDYKTGNPHLDLTTIPYGIGMQLPVYLYLAKNSSKLKNIKVAGFYLQKILNNEVTVDNTHTYEQLKKKNLLLQGYSNSDLSILSEFDTSYLDSNIIKSMKLKKDNNFSSYSKVLSTEEMDKITLITSRKINNGAKLITEGKFPISPKKIAKDNLGCCYCHFKDICFHTNDDIEELKPLKLEEILGGEENGMD